MMMGYNNGQEKLILLIPVRYAPNVPYYDNYPLPL